MPLVMIIRESLGFAKTSKEATRIINTGKVKVDGVVRRDHRFPVGLMDVLQIQGTEHPFRILPEPNQGLIPKQIDQKEAGFKLCKVVGKRTVSGGKTQLDLHDGRNLIIQARESRPKGEPEVAVGAAIQLGLPDQKIIRTVSFQTGALGLVIDGRNQGLSGKIASITPGTHARQKTVRIATAAEEFETPAAYVIPVGTEAPLVGLGGK